MSRVAWEDSLCLDPLRSPWAPMYSVAMANAIKMSLEEVMSELEAMGTEQNRKTYARHGASAPMFGVSFANQYALQKKIKCDHALALALWDTGNMDACVLATLIADPAQLTRQVADAWVLANSLDSLGGLIANLVVQAPWADAARIEWMADPREAARRVGWAMVGATLKIDPERISDEECLALMATIEAEIHTSPNRVRESMNWNLIAIGCAKHHLAAEAMAAAARIGKVVVDHGETHCKTPDAAAYIAKTLDRAASTKAKLRGTR